MIGRLVLVSVVVVGCGTVRGPLSSGPEEHAGEIACHGVLLPAKGAPRAMFLCAGSNNACVASREEHIAKGYAVSDCAPQPHAACFATDNGQICLGSLDECRDFAKSAARDPATCSEYASDIATPIGSFSGMYESTRGDAAVLRSGNAVEIRYAAGTMQCSIANATAACTWSEGEKKGRAKLAQQADGSWSGSYGEGESDASGGALSLRRKR